MSSAPHRNFLARSAGSAWPVTIRRGSRRTLARHRTYDTQPSYVIPVVGSNTTTTYIYAPAWRS
jgi:hypothetical protein